MNFEQDQRRRRANEVTAVTMCVAPPGLVAVVGFTADNGERFTERRDVLALEAVESAGLWQIGYVFASDDCGLVGSVSSQPWRGADDCEVVFELDGQAIPQPSVPVESTDHHGVTVLSSLPTSQAVDRVEVG